MDFLRRLMGGGGGGSRGFGATDPADRNAHVVYVQPTGCREVVRVRVNMMNDLSLNDAQDGYVVRKVVVATQERCFQRAEVVLTYDRNRRPLAQEITGGSYVDAAAYTAWQAAPATPAIPDDDIQA